MKRKSLNKITRNSCLTRSSLIGLDIGSARIKMAQFQRTGKTISLQNKVSVATPPDSVQDGRITGSKALIDILKKLYKANRWKGKKVVMTLPPSAFYLKRVQLPPMRENEIAQAMRWEVEKHFPLKGREAIYDFCPVDIHRTSRSISGGYLLAAVSEDTAEAYTSICCSAGFDPVALEILPFSLMRSMVKSEFKSSKDKSGYRLLIDIGFSQTSLLICRNQEYHFYRSIKFGLLNFLMALQDQPDPANSHPLQRLFKLSSLAEKGLEAVASSLTGQLATTAAYALEEAGQPAMLIKQVEICGGGASIPGLAALIESNLHLPPKLYNPLLSSFTAQLSSASKKQLSDGALFAPVHGMAMRGWIE